jgi:hypothetical protein
MSLGIYPRRGRIQGGTAAACAMSVRAVELPHQACGPPPRGHFRQVIVAELHNLDARHSAHLIRPLSATPWCKLVPCPHPVPRGLVWCWLRWA